MRLFIAIELPEAFKQSLDAYAQRLMQNVPGRWVTEDTYHLTLAFLGETDPDGVPRVIQAMQEAIQGLWAAPLEPEGFHMFGASPHGVLHLGMQAHPLLMELAVRMREALESQGISYDRKPFVPHITLARHVSLESLASLPLPDDVHPCHATHVVLYQSVLNANGARYEPIQKLNLPAPRDIQVLSDYYRKLDRSSELASRCVMHVPHDLAGKNVLDLWCRKGKGVFLLSDLVGEQGMVVGVDPDPVFIARARAVTAQNVGGKHRGVCQIDDAASEPGRSHKQPPHGSARVCFRYGFPEALASAGVAGSSFDVVISNSAFNVSQDPPAVLREAFRVLVPRGRFYHAGLFVADTELTSTADETLNPLSAVKPSNASDKVSAALSDKPSAVDLSDKPSAGIASDASSVSGTDTTGNVFQQAPSWIDFASWAEAAGFEKPVVIRYEMLAPQGTDADDGLSGRQFMQVIVSLTKPAE